MTIQSTNDTTPQDAASNRKLRDRTLHAASLAWATHSTAQASSRKTPSPRHKRTRKRMANSRANINGWLFGETLTEGQINQIDEGQARAVDNRAGHLEIETQSVTRLAKAQPVWQRAHDVDLQLAAPFLVITLSNTTREFYWPLHLPQGAIITGWSVTVQGDGGHSALPATRPEAHIVSPAGSAYGFFADPSANVGAYSAPHTISQTGLSLTVDNTLSNVYYLAISTEGGANARANTRFTKASVTYLVSKLDPGAE